MSCIRRCQLSQLSPRALPTDKHVRCGTPSKLAFPLREALSLLQSRSFLTLWRQAVRLSMVRCARAPGSCSLPLTHRHRAPGPVPALVEPHRAEGERQPTEIIGKAYHQNDPAGNRSDGGAIGEFRQGRRRHRMDRYLAVIGNHLDGENPNVVATQSPPRRADERDVVAGRSVVARENRLPVIVAGFTGEYWRVEIQLQPASAGAPDIKVAIAPRLHTEKHGNEQPYEQEG